MNTKKIKMSSLLEDPKNPGSSEAQIGLLTNKIKNLSDHFKNYKKDKHSSLGLVKAINKRKRLLDYLKRTNEKSYNNILEKLNLRK